MKQIKKVIIGGLISLPMISNAQFTPVPGGTAGRTNPAIQKIGIGFFPTNASIQAKLHINQFLLAPNPATNGLMFRTDGSNAQTNSWSMFTGAANNSLTEKFSITVPANSNNAVLSTTFQNGFMEFWTNNTLRMHINANFSPTNQGFIGMGNSFNAPQSRLHINEMDPVPPVNGGTACYAQWTNTATGNATANDGLRVGLSANGTAEIRQQENLPLIFYTNSIETARMIPNTASTLAGNPTMVGIGNFITNPFPIDAKLDIDGDLRIRTVTEDKTLTQILAIDPTDQNRVHWRSISGLGSGIGNYCPDTPNPLTDNFEIPLNNFAYNFTAGNDFGRVNIGNVPCGGGFPARLYVRQEDPMPGFPFHTAITAHTYGGLLPVNGPVYGTTSIVFNARSYTHAGLYAASVDAQNNIISAVTEGIGIIGTAFQNDINIGVIGIATDVSASENYGIYGEASGASGANYAGWFEGDVAVNGTPYILNPAQPLSDVNLKTNVNAINNANNIIQQLLPKSFNMDTANQYGLNFPSNKQYGFIAQDIELILPELVTEFNKPEVYDSTGNIVSPAGTFKTLNYNAFIAILAKGMQEQQQVINSLLTEMDDLKDCLRDANICAEGNRTINTEPSNTTNYKSIELTNVNSIILDQNLPNPFKENTVINYNIPTEVSEAKLLFYDLNGRIIKELIIDERGESKLTVYGTNLKTGIYTYSLIADGELIATKKMVKK
jgi:hypothetical protein